MTLRSFITAVSGLLAAIAFAGTSYANAPRVAVITPDESALSKEFAAALTDRANDAVKVMDSDLAASAFAAGKPGEPFNMSLDEAKKVGARLGTDAYILIRAVTERRNAFGKGTYFESYASVFLVSSRTGRLAFWTVEKAEKGDAKAAETALLGTAGVLALELAKQATITVAADLNTLPTPAMEEPPSEGSAAAKNFKAPIPFKRLKPEYTELAALHQVAATVEITVDLNEKGEILRTQIARWAGFGLDESVENAVRSMNWRPAERVGRFVPMRFLLRYNFKKIEKPSDQ